MTEINEKTIFVFDLNGVLFKLNILEVIKEAFKIPNKFKFIQILLYPHTLLKAYFSMYNGAVAEKIIINLNQKFPNIEFTSIGLKLLNAQTPVKQTIEIAQNLKQKGYKVYILSNIGPKSLDILKNKFPEIFNIFDGIMGTTDEDDYLQKPNPIAFEKFLIKYNQKRENLIFIDDQNKNINSAQNLGIKSILFKSPHSLKKQLINLKFLD